jgi:6-phosphofructokinase
MNGNLVIAHGGGPTAVINASLYGVIREAEKYDSIKGIYAARYGIQGVLKEDFIDLAKESSKNIELLPYTPSSAIGSCRRKLFENDYLKLINIFKKHNIRYFFYNGGNDSMDTCNTEQEKITNPIPSFKWAYLWMETASLLPLALTGEI